MPDYADLRSDVRRLLRHRGVSHSLLFAGAATALVYLLLTALSQADAERFRLHSELVFPLLLAFGLGIASHLVLDSATPSGIRPLLPFSGARLHILPRRARIATGGHVDGLVHTMASLIVMLGLIYLVVERVR